MGISARKSLHSQVTGDGTDPDGENFTAQIYTGRTGQTDARLKNLLFSKCYRGGTERANRRDFLMVQKDGEIKFYRDNPGAFDMFLYCSSGYE